MSTTTNSPIGRKICPCTCTALDNARMIRSLPTKQTHQICKDDDDIACSFQKHTNKQNKTSNIMQLSPCPAKIDLLLHRTEQADSKCFVVAPPPTPISHFRDESDKNSQIVLDFDLVCDKLKNYIRLVTTATPEANCHFVKLRSNSIPLNNNNPFHKPTNTSSHTAATTTHILIANNQKNNTKSSREAKQQKRKNSLPPILCSLHTSTEINPTNNNRKTYLRKIMFSTDNTNKENIRTRSFSL
eukprot:c9131_g1_i1.p1 GENE.c9131_g1_i1~~c9131_g1_i1.p1  ORF type:complete len:243 (+),score=72.58 c9131_g1_i1:162-890(+)